MNLSAQIFEEAKARGFILGFIEGFIEGYTSCFENKEMINHEEMIRSLIECMTDSETVDVKEAMDVLEIPVEMRQVYIQQILILNKFI